MSDKSLTGGVAFWALAIVDKHNKPNMIAGRIMNRFTVFLIFCFIVEGIYLFENVQEKKILTQQLTFCVNLQINTTII
jgi:cell division protein FtsB